jgi:rhodanese-related sulfurtransferase
MVYIIFIAVIFFFSWRFMPVKGVRAITTKQLKEELHHFDKLFIDVRTPKEFKTRRIEGFVNMPVGSDYSKLPKDKEIIIICQSGMRSLKVAKQLKALGYTNVTNVRGGMSAYRA